MANLVAVSAIAITGLAVICSNLNVGLTLGGEKVRIDRTAWGWMAKAMVLNFAIMPLLGLGLIWAFDLEGGLAVGLVLLSCMPGFPLLFNVLRGKARDTKGLQLTFFLLLLGTALSPLLIWLFPVEGMEAGLWEMMLLLTLFQLLPLLVGYLMGTIVPGWLVTLEDVLTFLIFVCTALIVLYIISSRYRDLGLLDGTHALLGVVALVLLGGFVGYMVGGPNPSERKASALGTSLRNFMSSLLLVVTFFTGGGTEMLVLLGGLFMLAIGIVADRLPASSHG